MKIREDDISQVNLQLKDSLQKWSDILVDADYKGWGVDLEFNEEDLLNILQMFNSIWANSAIKRGVFTEDNIYQKIELFKRAIEDVFDVKTVELTESVLGNNISELN